MKAKPNYEHHRDVVNASKEDTTIVGMISALKLRGESGTDLIRGAASCLGWKSVSGTVILTGTGATVSLQPYEVVRYKEDGDGETKDFFVELGPIIGPLSDGDTFTVDTKGALMFIAIDAVGGTVNRAEILLSGSERDLEALRVG